MPTQNPLALGDATSRFAEQVTALFDGYEHDLREDGAAGNVELVRRGETGAELTLPPGWTPHAMNTTAHAVAMHRLWRWQRVVHALHPGLVDHLISASSATLYGSIFRRLPYSSPLVSFPEPRPVTLPEGRPGALLGFQVTGVPHGAEPYCHTHDETMTGLSLLFFTETEDGQWAMTNSYVPLAKTFTVASVVDNTRLYLNAEQRAMTGEQRWNAWTLDTVGLALGVLLYLCTEDPDLEAVPVKRPKKKPGSGRARKPTRFIRTGWWLGPELARAETAARAPGTGASGGEKRPHARRAHAHIYLTGPGRTVPVVKFLNPIVVRRDKLTGGASPDGSVHVTSPQKPNS